MYYISLDIETTGLDPATCQMIEIGAVLENVGDASEEGVFHRYVVHAIFSGVDYALRMNKDIMARAKAEGSSPGQALKDFDVWLAEQRHALSLPTNHKFFVAGKNVGSFDFQFFPHEFIRRNFHHRTIDPGSVFMDWGRGPLSLGELLGLKVRHTAIEDARDVVRVLRRAYT